MDDAERERVALLAQTGERWDFDTALAEAGSIAAALHRAPTAEQRRELRKLIDAAVPVRLERRGDYDATIAWTPFGEVLAEAAGVSKTTNVARR